MNIKLFLFNILLLILSITACNKSSESGNPLDSLVNDPPKNISAIAAGDAHTCAIGDGSVKCWGLATGGRIDNGEEIGESNDQGWYGYPVQVVNLDADVAAVTAGVSHDCAIVKGSAKCWEGNFFGELGNGSWNYSNAPMQVSGLNSGVTAIGAGYNHNCAVVNGAAWCWGQGNNGQLGTGENGPIYKVDVPVRVTGLDSGVTAIGGGVDHSCAIVGTIAKCWGKNNFGQLGDNSTEDSLVPVEVMDSTGITMLSVGYNHNCAIINGATKCWGKNTSGQLGNDSTQSSSSPVQVKDITANAITIATGGNHSCAILQGGEAKCWGSNKFGQLGDGSTQDKHTPVTVKDLTSDVTLIAAGGGHSCALHNNTLKCWGNGASYQLGNGKKFTINPLPVNVFWRIW